MSRLPGHPKILAGTVLDATYSALSKVCESRGRLSAPTSPAILVYQMAKVGSSTVTRSIRGARPGARVFKIHTMTAAGMARMEEFYNSCDVPCLPWGAHLLASRYLVEQMQQGIPRGSWKVVSLVRDPVARNLSLLFQLGRRLIPDFEELCDEDRLDPVAVFDRFRAAFPHQFDCMQWFRDELGTAMGVDVFEVPFNREVGYQVYHGPLADILLIRTEDLDRCGEEILSSFLGLERFRWKHANIGLRKANSSRYKQILDRIRLPAAFVDRVYDSPEVRHFYTAQELERFRLRWCGNPGEDA